MPRTTGCPALQRARKRAYSVASRRTTPVPRAHMGFRTDGLKCLMTSERTKERVVWGCGPSSQWSPVKTDPLWGEGPGSLPLSQSMICLGLWVPPCSRPLEVNRVEKKEHPSGATPAKCQALRCVCKGEPRLGEATPAAWGGWDLSLSTQIPQFFTVLCCVLVRESVLGWGTRQAASLPSLLLRVTAEQEGSREHTEDVSQSWQLEDR